MTKVIWQKAASLTCHPRGCEWICPILTPSKTWFFGATRVSFPNGISIGSAVFAQYNRVTSTDTQTTLRVISIVSMLCMHCVLKTKHDLNELFVVFTVIVCLAYNKNVYMHHHILRVYVICAPGKISEAEDASKCYRIDKSHLYSACLRWTFGSYTLIWGHTQVDCECHYVFQEQHQLRLIDFPFSSNTVYDDKLLSLTNILLSLTNYISLSKACYYHIRQLRCIRPYLDSSTACTTATSIVHSKLDFCNSFYYKLSRSHLSRIQHIQNYLARTVVKAPMSYHVPPHPTLCQLAQNH